MVVVTGEPTGGLPSTMARRDHDLPPIPEDDRFLSSRKARRLPFARARAGGDYFVDGNFVFSTSGEFFWGLFTSFL